LRIQALYLQELGSDEMLTAALELLDELLNQYPDHFSVGTALFQKARCLEALARQNEALQVYRDSLTYQREHPGVRDSAYLGFGELVLKLGRADLLQEALRALQEFGANELFPADAYRSNAIRALAFDQLGHHAEARLAARVALAASEKTESPFRYHKKLGLVHDANTAIQERLRDLADMHSAPRALPAAAADTVGAAATTEVQGVRRHVGPMRAPVIPRTADDVVAACSNALALAPEQFPPNLPSEKELLGAPGWYRFEHEAWPIGESVRQSFQKTPSLKRSGRAMEAVMSVVEQVNLRRGRQSFVMALGFTAAARFAPRVARFVSDPDIDGQVVGTLLKMKVSGFADAVRPLLEDKHAWIRSLAEKYVARYP
jgi:tetratricopeptide (TPR) repeat protein